MPTFGDRVSATSTYVGLRTSEMVHAPSLPILHEYVAIMLGVQWFYSALQRLAYRLRVELTAHSIVVDGSGLKIIVFLGH